MAVIIREERIIGGKKFKDTKVYRSDKFAVTKKAQQQAEKLDRFLANTLYKIREKVRRKKRTYKI